jgi:DNA-binding MarR family transcriptional regulator
MQTNTTFENDEVARVGRPFLARRIAQLHELLAEQGQAVLSDAGIDLDARLGSVFYLVATRRGLSVAALAEALGLSHQLATYRVKKLVEAGLVIQERDPECRTRSVLQPAAEAEPKVRKLQAVMRQLDRVYGALFDELGVDLFELTTRARKALMEASLQERARNARE